MSPEELAALPLREQRKYKTRIMLMDILKSQNLKRSTVSLKEAVNHSSHVAEFVRLDVPKPKTLAVMFNEKL